MKLLSHFYQVSGPGLSHPTDATAYLLEGKHGMYLIDCGTVEGYDLINENIRTLGFDPANILAIYGTHGHYDHVGAASLFLSHYNIPLYLHPADQDCVETGDPMKTTANLLYGRTFPPCPVAGPVEAGVILSDENFTLDAIHTPGHSPGGICYVLRVEGKVILIAGDTLHGGFSPLAGSDEAAWRDSLEDLCRRHFDFYVFGHCSPLLLGDADTRLDCLKRSFGIYYSPWFKTFDQTYIY